MSADSSPTRPVRLGFIGGGGYGRVQIDGYLFLQAEGLVQIAGLADPSASVLGALGELPELRSARCFLDYREMLAQADLDAVVICTPIPLHEEMTLAALERDLFVLLEKPPVPLLSQLDRLTEADRKGRVMIAFQHIYSDLISSLKRELVNGRIGRVQSLSAHGLWPRTTSYYGRAGWAGQLTWRGLPVLDGPCTNGLSHFLNIVLYLAGREEADFAAPAQITGELYRARPGLATYDTGCLSGTLENNVRFFVGFTHAAAETQPVEIRIEGTEGRLLLVEDAQMLQSEDGETRRGNDGRDFLRRSFIAFARGDAAANRTPLRATRPYVLATNMMFASSGGIHSVPGSFIRRIDEGTENAIYAIDGLGRHLALASTRLKPLRQLGVPWAVDVPALSATAFSENILAPMLAQDAGSKG